MKKFLLLLGLSVCVACASDLKKDVECQNTPLLVLLHEEDMCSADLEKIADNADVRVKRVVAKYQNLNKETVLKLSKVPDLELKKRLLINKSTSDELKKDLSKQIDFFNKQKELDFSKEVKK